MDIYLTYLETGDVFRFPMLPETFSVKTGNQFASYSVLGLGEVKVPSGKALDSVSWSGKFPGWIRKNAPYIREWSPILECIGWMENLKAQVGVTKKCRLLVTETNINLEVYLSSFDGNYVGGLGDYDYSISFVQAVDLAILSSPVEVNQELESNVDVTETVSRPDSVTSSSYTVVSGDTLWGISQRYLGSGAKYDTLYQMNQSTIDAWNLKYGNSKYTIYPGQVFTVG